jgi:hypothetical protein
MDPKDITALQKARDRLKDAARPDIVTRVHGTEKLTARERIELLLDPDSCVEYGGIAARTRDGDWVGEAGGVDFVGTLDGRPVIASSTDYTDHGGGYGAGRLGRLFALAVEQRWPVVMFVDGGGSRARHPRAGLGHIETSGPVGRFSFLDGVPELSGWAPVVAIEAGEWHVRFAAPPEATIGLSAGAPITVTHAASEAVLGFVIHASPELDPRTLLHTFEALLCSDDLPAGTPVHVLALPQPAEGEPALGCPRSPED